MCNLGDSLTTEMSECMPIFLERLKNEITRLTTVKALTMIARYRQHYHLVVNHWLKYLD